MKAQFISEDDNGLLLYVTLLKFSLLSANDSQLAIGIRSAPGLPRCVWFLESRKFIHGRLPASGLLKPLVLQRQVKCKFLSGRQEGRHADRQTGRLEPEVVKVLINSQRKIVSVLCWQKVYFQSVASVSEQSTLSDKHRSLAPDDIHYIHIAYKLLSKQSKQETA